MDPAAHSSADEPPLRRARVACKSCNARRVKCDVGEGRPCWHCRMRQINCELMESRRGKYARKKSHANKPLQTQQSRHAVNDSQAIDTTPAIAQVHTVLGSSEASTYSPIGQYIHNEGQNESFCDSGRQNSGTDELRDRRVCPEPRGHTEDSSVLSYMIELTYKPEGGLPRTVEIHHSIPASIAHRTSLDKSSTARSPVSLDDAMMMPPGHVADQLVRTFFSKLHPAYPVFDRERFSQLYMSGQASPLVLQTIFFLGFTIGSDEVIHAAGFDDRAKARRTYYLRAKALYDADYESDHMNLVAVMLLLGFWWSGPDDQKDTCHWVGCATTFAQTLTMHRVVSESAMNQRMRSMRRRIWWSIYMRDRHTSVAFGRPCRIRDEDCDVEPLGFEDFMFDLNYDETLILPQKDCHVLYVLEMSKLALILGDVLTAEFSPRCDSREKFRTENLGQRLSQWESGLCAQLLTKNCQRPSEAWFWTTMMQFCYQNCIILLFRPKVIDNLSPGDFERDSRARAAADAITRLAEDMLATDLINSGLIHLVQSLFSAISIHTIVICRSDSYQRQLAENKSRQCMLALSVIAKSWPVRIWISKSFVCLMKRLTRIDPASNGSTVEVSSSIAATSRNRSLHRDDDLSQISTNIIESDAHCTCNGSQSSGLHAHGCSFMARDQLVHDSLWARYLDEAWDVDLFLHDSTGSLC